MTQPLDLRRLSRWARTDTVPACPGLGDWSEKRILRACKALIHCNSAPTVAINLIYAALPGSRTVRWKNPDACRPASAIDERSTAGNAFQMRANGNVITPVVCRRSDHEQRQRGASVKSMRGYAALCLRHRARSATGAPVVSPPLAH
jgi:hypothetical protein